MLNRIPNIDLEISGVCNLHCPGCWGTPRLMRQTHSFDEIYSLLEKLQTVGLQSISISGGEPTLVEGLDEFIKTANNKMGLEIYLQSNGFFLIPLLPKIAPYVHTISLSLEGSNPKNNSFRRGPLAFGKAMDSLKQLDENYPGIKVKIGTCVFKQNISDMPALGKTLLEHGFGDRYPNRGVWKLYQITRFGSGKDDPALDSMLLTDKEFQKMADTVKRQFEGKIAVTCISSKEMGGYCIIIRPDGKIVSNAHSPLAEEEVIFQNIFEDVDGGIQAIINFQNPQHVKERLEKTYFFEWAK